MESFYVLWRTTGDEVWRERGWKVFEAIEKHTKTASGYASLNSVYRLPAWQKDEMPRCVLTFLSFPAYLPSDDALFPQLLYSRNVSVLSIPRLPFVLV